MTQTDPFNPNSGLFFGCEFYIDGTAVNTLNSANSQIACKMVPLVSKQVDTLQILNWGHGGVFVSMTIELQSDNNGQPSGTVLASGTFTPSANFTWNSVALGTPFSVVAGTTYWIVIHSANITATNTLDIRRVDDPGHIITPTYQMMTSSNGGSTWANAGATFGGCAGFGYHDGTFEGLGYGDFDTNNIGNTIGNSTWGEYFQVPTQITISAITMPIFANAAGTPSADCTVVLQNADTSTILAQGTIVTAAQITQTATLYTFQLPSNITLNPGTNYRVYLQSNATASPQFTIRTPKSTNTGNGNAMTFGGAADVRTNGSSQSADHDATFKLTLFVPSGATPLIPKTALLGAG